MNRTSLLRCAALAALVCAAASGCGKSAPDGMPETVPFSVKVVDGSKGIADVQVVMDSEAGVGAVSGTNVRSCSWGGSPSSSVISSAESDVNLT